jgi:hypothetical protein
MGTSATAKTVVYLVEELRDTGEGKQAVTPIRAYTSKKQAEKHAQDLQMDLFSDQYYTWVAIEVWDRYEPRDES